MKPVRVLHAFLLIAWVAFLSHSPLRADQTPPPALNGVTVTNSQKTTTWTPYPAAQQYQILSSTNPAGPFTNDASGAFNGSSWTVTNNNPSQFFRLSVSPLSSNAVLGVTVLNRLAYGPTPDDLQTILTNAAGAQAYINQQLAPWNITETVDGTHTNLPNIEAKFVEVTNAVTTNSANISDLRAWHVLRGVGAQRQLVEILLQFFENHFVTQYSKTQSYIDGQGLDSTTGGCVATQFEYLENERWRNALLNPGCTFSNLLRISAESPAMIIYLDTVLSKGNSRNVANENYARELMELFTVGVNNGYDQTDITLMSRCWTGWSVQKVDFTNVDNPFATVITNVIATPGAWVLNYLPNNHGATSNAIFPGKTVPVRFGAPWAGRNYELDMPVRPTGDTNGIQDGYDVITHLSNLPFTEEFISVKLCNLFVHDGFAIGYDFTDPGLSPEGQLVKSCMLTWETNAPKGQIWLVLSNIFSSDLFRGNAAAMQKVKTPLEFTISGIRALRVSTNGTGTNGTFTADTDGYSISGSNSTSYPLNRMGSMLLFDREFPNGYPENAEGWVSAGTLAERIRWMQSYLMPASATDSNKSDGINGHSVNGNQSVCNPVQLLQLRLTQQNPSASMNSAGDVADYFLGMLFAGEGKANLDQYRTTAISYLNDGTTDSPPSNTPFSSIAVSAVAGSAYDTRVRGVVAMLMGFQRFQEQ